MGPLGKTVLLAGLAALAAAGVRYGTTAVRLAEAEREVEVGGSRLQELGSLVAAVEQYRQGRETVELKTALISELRRQPAVPWGLLGQLVSAAPGGLTLEGVSAQGSSLEITGRADSLDRVAGWVEQLQGQGLEELDLQGFDGGRGVFTLVGRLPGRAEASGEHSEPGA